MSVVYVDDMIFATAYSQDLDADIKALKILMLEQWIEGEVSAFLALQKLAR
jgi:hypothetical protein